MKPNPANLARLWTTIINDRLMGQWLRLREYWEPELDSALTQIAEASMQIARQIIAEQSPQAWEIVQLDVTTISRQAVRVAQDLLQEMVREQYSMTISIMTMGGMFQVVKPFASHTQEARVLEDLAGGQALAESVNKSRDEFLARLRLALEQAEDAQVRAEQIQAAGRWWRARLATISHTVLYAVANRVRMTVSELL